MSDRVLGADGMRILVVDNYDSFVYNLVQYLGELGVEPLVYRHDALTLDEMDELAEDARAVPLHRLDPRAERVDPVLVPGLDRGAKAVHFLERGQAVDAHVPARAERPAAPAHGFPACTGCAATGEGAGVAVPTAGGEATPSDSSFTCT